MFGRPNKMRTQKGEGCLSPLAAQLRFDARVVLITGAGAGIGRATAMAFARAGASVAVTDIDGARAAQVADEISGTGGRAFPARLDVTDEREVDRVTEETRSRFGSLDVLVNNAGVGARVATADLPTDQWQRVLGIGLTGAFFCPRAAAKPMIAQGSGAIVNVASIMGLSGGGLYPNPAYHAVKGALVNLTRAWALEWAPHGIRVNAIAPGYVKTDMSPVDRPEFRQNWILDAPLQRYATPEEIAPSVVYLASPASSFMTGSVVVVDGG
jgi:NAD(P)-dependent dehydrogenase (short-subunit alcohol dehydrogenase family)